MRQLIAMGGGGFSMEPDNLLLDQYVLAQVDSASPKICFVPTASGDAESYIERFYTAFHPLPCEPSHLSLFEPAFQDIESFVLSQDILYVGGGNTRNMLALWREWGLDLVLRKAYEQGIVLTGLSAGSICWFQEGLTDPLNAPLYKLNALGFIPGSHCPHYDGEALRRPSYQRLIEEGNMQAGYGVDDGAALHFINETLYLTVSSREQASAYYVERTDDGIKETKMTSRYLGTGSQSL